uniref:Dihydrolipoyl dehydrogenase n=1 Tax=Candidatus Kentrum eta TaxID=2126337 RepID=A0A450UXJ6_9GAMM|nr:MAG: dihydrolipoamide dehydrogenase [Candidatus Kentron sp. H]VFJ97232.1 MAG: dihydrolipoamide dehydrogenase [Candidatus Kentron sp. H]VFK02750.1 MAG: dihydrolipoamide dehydrogenase [Candidatus Kentron sp. H]
MQNYDVIVIGAGPGGYVAAIRAAQLGLKTACVDRWLDAAGKPSLGGTCLNVGCIPSKALLDSALHYHNLTHLLPAHGIRVAGAGLDIPAMQARKDKVVRTLTTGIKGLFKKNHIAWLPGEAAFLSANRIRVSRHRDGDEAGEASVIEAPNIIIATGSAPMALPTVPVDNEHIVDSTGALNFRTVPKRLGIIGAGVIGLELGNLWRRLGSEVVLLETEDEFLPRVDGDIAQEARGLFKRQGLDIRLGASVTSVAVMAGGGADGEENGVTVTYRIGDETHALERDKLVVACGRVPITSGLGLERIGLATDAEGRIRVDEHCRTGVAGVHAIGDVVRGPMLAHKASEEGVAVAERIAGQAAHVNYETIPWVIYTHPEIAWVGKTEQALEAEGIPFRVGRFPLRAIGRAHGAGETDGFIKILGHAKTDRILGAHLFSANASELIAEIVIAMEFSASTEDIARIVHAHPTLSEATHEAALAVDGRAIHF